jgi:quercetin dioxygenase-like cupin family protein
VIFELERHPTGVEASDGYHVVYDVARNEACFGATRVSGPALVWRVGGFPDRPRDGIGEGGGLAVEVELDPGLDWLVRCDRVDFPPGGVAHRHTHPGPGIRCLLFGGLRIERPGGAETVEPGDAWFEAAGEPVRAAASELEETAFVRVLLLPGEWMGRRTIRYLDPADEDKPKRQRATILLERPLPT